MAAALDAQGERALAAEVRNFTQRLPPASTDKERIAVQYMELQGARKLNRFRETRALRLKRMNVHVSARYEALEALQASHCNLFIRSIKYVVAFNLPITLFAGLETM